MDREITIIDLKAMIEADRKDLNRALENGDRTEAHDCVDALIDNIRRLEILEKAEGR